MGQLRDQFGAFEDEGVPTFGDGGEACVGELGDEFVAHGEGENLVVFAPDDEGARGDLRVAGDDLVDLAPDGAAAEAGNGVVEHGLHGAAAGGVGEDAGFVVGFALEDDFAFAAAVDEGFGDAFAEFAEASGGPDVNPAEAQELGEGGVFLFDGDIEGGEQDHGVDAIDDVFELAAEFGAGKHADGDGPAQRVGDEADAGCVVAGAQVSPQDLQNAAGEGLGGVDGFGAFGGVGLVAVATAGEIDEEKVVARGERAGDKAPHGAICEDPVHEDEDFAPAGSDFLGSDTRGGGGGVAGSGHLATGILPSEGLQERSIWLNLEFVREQAVVGPGFVRGQEFGTERAEALAKASSHPRHAFAHRGEGHASGSGHKPAHVGSA